MPNQLLKQIPSITEDLYRQQLIRIGWGIFHQNNAWPQAKAYEIIGKVRVRNKIYDQVEYPFRQGYALHVVGLKGFDA